MHPNHDPFDFDDAATEVADDASPGRPSKTQLKKNMHELQTLGKALIELPDARLKAIGMPESLLDALLALKRTRSHEGRRRQLQYVGKLMRTANPEPLREAVASFKLPGARETLALHTTERWRDRLLADDQALTQWMSEFPDTDSQALRTLIRNARKENLAVTSAAATSQGLLERKGRAYRDLFQFIKNTLPDTQPTYREADGDTDAETDEDDHDES